MNTGISMDLSDNEQFIRNIFANCQDVLIQCWGYGPSLAHTALSVYCESLATNKTHNDFRVTLQDVIGEQLGRKETVTPLDIIEFFESNGASTLTGSLVATLQEAVDKVMNGYVVIFIHCWNKGIAYKAHNVPKRQVEPPPSEPVVQGPREGTVENLQTNIGMLRDRIRTPMFKAEFVEVGLTSRTQIAILYLEHIVHQGALDELRRRLDGIESCEVLGTSYVEDWIEDARYSPFPQFLYTERTDSAAAALLDGKILVLAQNTPMVLICPAVFAEFFSSPGDYYQRTLFASLIRQLRILAFLIALTLPSIYIALSTFHPELIPSVLLLASLDAREGIPFPVFIEALIMEIFLELLREAGIRLPRPVGSAVSIVGALVIGQAAIQARIASPIVVIVVALTGISSFALPQYNMAITLRILRFPLMVLAGMLGGFGLMIGFLWILLHLCRLNSLGQPYLTGLSPLKPGQIRDVFVRTSLKQMMRHPRNRRLGRTFR